MRQHWKVEDGVLVYDGKANNLCTAKDYGDFEMFVDWKIGKGGDSGIYLRGSPQVQIWDNKIGSGGLYNNQKLENPHDPLKFADKPIGQWNTLRIKMVGEKVRVWLNGELVMHNVTLENYWERNKPIYPTGQIELQHHGSRLWFKNIYLRELVRATGTNSACGSSAAEDLKIFSGERRLFASYGPSTTLGYPARLQRKFYRYTGKSGKNCPLQISNYSIGGAQWRMPGWINCKPSASDPNKWEAFRSDRYLKTVQKLIKDNPGTPVIVMAMNNTGYACIPTSRILGPGDTEHINLARNFMRTHIKAILYDGAALYFLSPKKYWRDLDDPHEWNRNEERYALAPIAAEKILKGKRFLCAKCRKRSPRPVKTPAPWYRPACLKEIETSNETAAD